MIGTVLLVLNEGFDDFAFLSCQVIFEEHNFDIIIASIKNSTCKGIDNSVITVSLEEALRQNIDYRAIVIVGGKNLENWELLENVINEFKSNNKAIGGIKEGVKIIKKILPEVEVSDNNKPIENQNVITLMDPDGSEEFAESFVKIIS